MEIEFYGANCFRVRTKKGSIVFDDNLDSVGHKNTTKDGDVVFYTQRQMVSSKVASKARLVIDSPGEFEVGDLTIKAVQTRAHMDEEDKETATVYQCMLNNTTVTILGHVHPEMNDQAVELAAGTDVLIVPVGGNGYTLDAVGAAQVVKKLEPSVVIPSHFDASGFKFEVPASPVEEFHKVSALAQDVAQDVYKVDKPNPELANQTHTVVLNIKKA